ncbi:hypothetical protein MVEG_11819 [Podila verticillata NRRL 6337]|uniref:COI1 F-box domain-containing protein n=1 Tax=Podila verticillata NRRL 6337 TaxID=1069443 RepID=A0A086TJQ3_9FUNG|nr:hypothetical protein MVEG_11819 [Podila verticillata NRRL 6337]
MKFSSLKTKSPAKSHDRPLHGPRSPLDVTELLEHIISYIDEHNMRVAVVHVCRRWYFMNQHNLMRELVWHTTSNSKAFARFIARIPSAGRIRWFSQFRGVAKNENTPQWKQFVSAIGRNCKHLQQETPPPKYGTWQRGEGRKNIIKTDKPGNLRLRQTYLRELELNGYVLSGNDLGGLLRLLNSLTSLKINTFYKTVVPMDHFLRHCPKLLTLHLGALPNGHILILPPWIPIELQHNQTTSPGNQANSTVFSLRSLYLQCTILPQLELEELLGMTPHLHELKLINLQSYNFSPPMPQYDGIRLIQHIKALNLPLTSFHFSKGGSEMPDMELQETLNQFVGQILEWSLWGYELKYDVFKCLRLQSNHITSLEIINNQWTYASTVKGGLHDYLCASPHLLHLKTPQMFFPLQRLDLNRVDNISFMDHSLRSNFRHSPPRQDLYIGPGVWACRRLKTLHMGFHRHGDVNIGAPVHGRILYGYLSRVCPNLQDLQIRMSDIDSSLEGGLCLLSKLQSLQTLVIAISAAYQKYERAHLEWMADCPKSGVWQRLQKFAWLEKEGGKSAGRTLDSFVTVPGTGLNGQAEDRLMADLKMLGLIQDVNMLLEGIDEVKNFRCWPLLQGISVYSELDDGGELEMDVA